MYSDGSYYITLLLENQGTDIYPTNTEDAPFHMSPIQTRLT